MKEEGAPCVYHCISRIVGAAFLLDGERSICKGQANYKIDTIRSNSTLAKP